MSGVRPYSKPAKTGFLRCENEKLQVAVVDYVPIDGSHLRVTLIGAVHIGDEQYYKDLDAEFDRHQKVLYEMVGPKGAMPSANKGQGSFLSRMLNHGGMAAKLGLTDQKTHVNYNRANFVHADLSGQDMLGANPILTGVRLVLDAVEMMGSKKHAKIFGDTEQGLPAELIGLMRPGSGGDPRKAKKVLGKTLPQSLELMEGFTVLNRTLIVDRNSAVLEELDRQIAAGVTEIGIFYGAGHNPDFHRRFAAEYGFKVAAVRWLTAWDLSDPTAPVPAPQPQPKQP